MRTVHEEPGINARRHTTTVKPLKPGIVAVNAQKLINNVFLSYDCHWIHGAFLWGQGAGHRQNTGPKGNMCRTT